MSSRLLLLAATTGYQTRVFADAARRLGYELTLATDRCHKMDDPWGDQAIPVKFEHPAAFARRIAVHGPFDGLVAVGDRPTVLAAETAALLGLKFHAPAAARASHDKYLARRLFEAAGLPVPSYFRVPVTAPPPAHRAPYPCVLKPLGLSASRGVIRADSPAEFEAAFLRIRALLEAPEVARTREDQNRFIQVESYIEGREFAVEGLVTGGRLQILALFDKPDPLVGPYFEETIYVTPSREPAPVREAIREAVTRAVRALGLCHGPVHAELRYNHQGAWMLEVAARPIGGLCAKALRFDGGMPLEELILRHAAGEDVSAARLSDAASGVMMIPIPRAGVYEDVAGLERAREIPGIEDVIVTAKTGQELVPLPEGSSYLGFIFARGNSAVAVEQALRCAHGALRFSISTVLPTLRPSDA